MQPATSQSAGAISLLCESRKFKGAKKIQRCQEPFQVFRVTREKTMISADLLRRLRNDLPMPVTIAALGRDGPPSKMSEGYFRFLCPRCGEMRATVNPRNNLAHCFCCKKNLNNIDLLITLGYDFRTAVSLLERWLNQYQALQARKKKYSAADPPK